MKKYKCLNQINNQYVRSASIFQREVLTYVWCSPILIFLKTSISLVVLASILSCISILQLQKKQSIAKNRHNIPVFPKTELSFNVPYSPLHLDTLLREIEIVNNNYSSHLFKQYFKQHWPVESLGIAVNVVELCTWPHSMAFTTYPKKIHLKFLHYNCFKLNSVDSTIKKNFNS